MKHFVMALTGIQGVWMLGAAFIQMSSISFVRSPGSLMMNVLMGLLNVIAFVVVTFSWHAKHSSSADA